jgi:hypothetical protein
MSSAYILTSWQISYNLVNSKLVPFITPDTDGVENNAPHCLGQSSLWDHDCLRSCYSATAAAYLFIPRSLPSSGRCLYSHYLVTGLHATILNFSTSERPRVPSHAEELLTHGDKTPPKALKDNVVKTTQMLQLSVFRYQPLSVKFVL